MIQDAKVARETVERLTDYYKFHGHPIDAFEADDVLHLKINHCEGAAWKEIKLLRDEYDRFVGQPGLLPSAIVTSAIETANFRKWRYAPLDAGRQGRYNPETASESYPEMYR
jgi:hypothetical protein